MAVKRPGIGGSLVIGLSTGSFLMAAWLLVLLALFSGDAKADSSEAKVSELLSAYPRASVEIVQESVLRQYRLPTGRMQSRAGDPFASNWDDLPGGIRTEVLYRLNSARNTDDVLEHYLAQLNQQQAKILFQCGGRDCGPSVDWANRIFQMSTLYGVDRKQHYVAAQKVSDLFVDYFALYITERGTGRIYAYVAHYQVKNDGAQVTKDSSQAVSVADDYQALQRMGWMILPLEPQGEIKTGAESALQALSREIKSADNDYWLVSHNFSGQSDEASLSLSEQAAAKAVDVLEAFDFPVSRLTVKSLGAIAPTAASVAEGGRIELVIKR